MSCLDEAQVEITAIDWLESWTMIVSTTTPHTLPHKRHNHNQLPSEANDP